MFVPCPHCQFLVAHHPQLRPLPAHCPRCGRPLQEDIESTATGAIGPTSGHDQDIDAAGNGAHLHAPAQDSGGATGSTYLDSGPDAISGDVASADETSPAGAGEAIAPAGKTPSSAADEAVALQQPPAPSAASDAPAPAAAFAASLRRGGWARWRWPLVALLALLLVLQILLADRARLAADPRWRPLIETVCDVLHCSLPAWHQPDAFTMLDRKVRPASQPAGALRVDATFRNDARWAQAWPALQLALSDADGRVLGSRVFQPADYLGAAPTTMLSPGQSAQITFLVQEPAPGTVAFSFEFR